MPSAKNVHTHLLLHIFGSILAHEHENHYFPDARCCTGAVCSLVAAKRSKIGNTFVTEHRRVNDAPRLRLHRDEEAADLHTCTEPLLRTCSKAVGWGHAKNEANRLKSTYFPPLLRLTDTDDMPDIMIGVFGAWFAAEGAGNVEPRRQMSIMQIGMRKEEAMGRGNRMRKDEGGIARLIVCSI